MTTERGDGWKMIFKSEPWELDSGEPSNPNSAVVWEAMMKPRKFTMNNGWYKIRKAKVQLLRLHHGADAYSYYVAHSWKEEPPSNGTPPPDPKLMRTWSVYVAGTHIDTYVRKGRYTSDDNWHVAMRKVVYLPITGDDAVKSVKVKWYVNCLANRVRGDDAPEVEAT